MTNDTRRTYNGHSERLTYTAEHKKAAPVLQHRDGGKEADMYTEYGYMVNGVEYATIDEALAALDDD